MLYLADIFQFVIHGLNQGAFPEQNLVIEVHQGVLHVLPYPRDQMDVVHKECLEEVLADVSPVGEQLSEELFREVPVLQRLPVIHVSRRELPLYDFPPVVDDYMQLETIEPSHGTFSLCRPAFHGLVLPFPLDVAGYQGRGVDDGYSRAFAQRAGLEEEQQVKGDLGLALHEAVVGNGTGEVPAHMLANISKIE